MKPLEAELVLLYSRQARLSLARVVELMPLREGSREAAALERALFNVAELERRIELATRPTR